MVSICCGMPYPSTGGHCLLYLTRGLALCVQADLHKTQLNVLSSCEETDAMEDLSSLRSRGRRKKVLSLSHLAVYCMETCKALGMSVSGTTGRQLHVCLGIQSSCSVCRGLPQVAPAGSFTALPMHSPSALTFAT